MTKAGVEADIINYNTAIKACDEAPRSQQASALRNEREDVEADVNTYNIP